MIFLAIGSIGGYGIRLASLALSGFLVFCIFVILINTHGKPFDRTVFVRRLIKFVKKVGVFG